MKELYISQCTTFSASETCPMLMDDLPPATYYEDPACVFDDPQTDQVCTAGCLDGFEMRGNPNRTCLPSGSWSPRQFECRSEL